MLSPTEEGGHEEGVWGSGLWLGVFTRVVLQGHPATGNWGGTGETARSTPLIQLGW